MLELQGLYYQPERGVGGGMAHPDLKEVQLMRHFSAFASARNAMAGTLGFGESGHAIMSRLKATHDVGGTTHVLGLDPGSAIEAAHLYEELVARYTAGQKRGGRPDREAVRSSDLSHLMNYPVETIADRVVSHCNGEDDTYVIFTASPGWPARISALLNMVDRLRDKGACVCVVAPESREYLLERCDIPFGLPTDDPAVALGLQSSLLHGMCEGVEPEWTSMSSNESKGLFPKMFRSEAEVEQRLAEDSSILADIITAGEAVRERMLKGGTLFGMGNGGSACDALQLLTRYESEPLRDREFPRVDKGVLSPGYLTCCQNDGLAAFRRAIESVRTPENVFFAYTTSGNSENVISAVELAREKDMFTVVFTGGSGGKIAGMADHEFIVPHGETGSIQVVHWTIGSALASI